MTLNVRQAAARKAMRDHDISQCRTCRLVGFDPKTVWRDRPSDNPEVREEMKAVAAVRRWFGHRQIGVLLEHKGMFMNNNYWQHKTINVHNCVPKISQPKAKAVIRNIRRAETKGDVENVFDLFVKTYESKYPTATLCL